MADGRADAGVSAMGGARSWFDGHDGSVADRSRGARIILGNLHEGLTTEGVEMLLSEYGPLPLT